MLRCSRIAWVLALIAEHLQNCACVMCIACVTSRELHAGCCWMVVITAYSTRHMAILHLLVEMVPFDRSPDNSVANGETHSSSDDVFQRSYQRTAYSVDPPKLSDSPVTLAKSKYSTPNPDLRELLVNDPEGDHSQMSRSRRDVSVATTPARTTVISSSSSFPNGAYSGSISASGGQGCDTNASVATVIRINVIHYGNQVASVAVALLERRRVCHNLATVKRD
uniref:Uncharacterized protein n=1 Tax=Timema poppense TaxID=170557 RepID=A0A7R9CZJ7_TIMPO|nr:unnamed protein product [Timema poppensis]